MKRIVLMTGLLLLAGMVSPVLGQNDCYNPTMREAKASYDKGDYRRAEQLYREASECYDCTAQQKAQARKQATECRRKIEADEAAERRRQEGTRLAEERRREEAAAAARKRKEEARLAGERRQREEALRQKEEQQRRREEELNRREEQQRQREETFRREEEQAAERKRQAEERRKLEEAERNKITLNVGGVEFKMVRVEGGTFAMGCTSEQEDDCHDWEKPVHSVTLSSYYIGETEVTQALWEAVMGNNPSHWKGDDLPVAGLTWDEAQEFIQKLNRLTCRTFRLPTEAEWEYAARGGSKSRGYKYSGSNSIDDVAWYKGNSGKKPHPVKGKQANELGIYDMSGNVEEWCSDSYGDYNSGSQHDPEGSPIDNARVMRGGYWFLDAWFCRVSNRWDCYAPNTQSDHFGFRLVLDDNPTMTENHERNDTFNKRDEIFAVRGVEFKMVWVEGGTFTMGCTSEHGEDCDDNEKPAHSVTLSSYYIGETEVTQALWEAVMVNNPSEFKGNNLPVEQVSWDDVQKFVQKLNRLTGRTFRLPTEAEWEYAGRGGSKSRDYKYSGSNSIKDVAWYTGNSGKKPHPVKEKRANELGLYDMSGNVWEWCSDWYGEYNHSLQHNAEDIKNVSVRALRGGAWNIYAGDCRVSRRLESSPGHRYNFVGFRLVLCP